MTGSLTTGRLLVVDDSGSNREMLARVLEPRGHEVVCVADGASALEHIASHDVDLVLLDIVMPGMTGLEVLAKIRNAHPMTELAVIIVTAMGASEDIASAIESGANDYICKPLDARVLRARVSGLVHAVKLNRIRSEFSRIASHDLWRPLSSLLASVAILEQVSRERSDTPTRESELLSSIKADALELRAITERFVDPRTVQDGQIQASSASQPKPLGQD